MPLLDVSELLSDPDFIETFTVIRSASSVGDDGMTVLVPQTIPNVTGSVQPASSQDLQRLPDAEYQKGAQTVFTTFRLTSGGSSYTADVLLIAGAHYTVQTVDDWSRYGAGYVKALVTLSDITP